MTAPAREPIHTTASQSGWENDSSLADAGAGHAAFVCRLFDELNRRRVEYLVMRNYRGYPAVLHKPDIGLLISNRHRRLFMHTMKTVCLELGYVSFRNTRRRSGVAITAIQFAAQDGHLQAKSVKVDARIYESFNVTPLQRRIHGFSYRLFYEQVQRRPVIQDGCCFHVFDQPDELIFLLNQWTRKKDPRYRSEIIQILSIPSMNRWFCEAIGSRAPVDPDSFLASCSPVACEKMVWRMVRKRWGPHTPRRVIRTHLRALRVRIRNAAHGWGALVYFSGPDGCGKTTLALAATEILARHDVETIYFYSLRKILRFLIQRFAWSIVLVGHALRATRSEDVPGKTRDGVMDFRQFRVQWEHGTAIPGTLFWGLRKRVALVIGIADILLGFVLATFHRVKGRIVIVETSPYDVFVKYRMPEFAVMEGALSVLIPRPTLGFLIHVDPERLVARKSELSAPEIEQYYVRVERVLDRWGARKRFVDIDNNQAKEQTMAMVCSEIFPVLDRTR